MAGILIGNSRIPGKGACIRFFDNLTGLMQMLLFFLLGLLAFPSRLPAVALPALGTALFLTFVARPSAVALVLGPLRCPLNQIGFVSNEWTGQKLADLSLHDELILLIRRGEKVLIPSGDTVLRAGDELVAAQKRP